ncbi:hypothetical protein FN846DRAFT_895466 [Sphaerosporella brunnea]|uniref:SH3 domain-containing protein n=1 Tax=Sphaerosporella brunnea TaxID=1250544 RepID=A0A5J5EFZ4_9PEZI|nr:hypothetical protein FN846DRAFT_895466 [Sphaerosporella brunnea]
MADPNITPLHKASLQRLLTELEFLTREGVVSNEDNAAMQQRLNAARAKVGVVKFRVTCAFSFAKRRPFQVSVDAGEKFEVINNDDPDWYLGRVVDGNGVVGWAPKNKFN